ncbi:hypothetical protein BC937DRAFT_93992, partial [Endogone sp. FLAS-F59071]
MRFSSKTLVNGDSWKIFACRFKKHHYLKSAERQPLQLHVFETSAVRIERPSNTPGHSHSVEDIEQEAVKPYTPPAIAIAVREIAKNIGITTAE